MCPRVFIPYHWSLGDMKLKMKQLRARREDLKHAVRDALYTERLITDGHLSFELFMELNSIVRNIKVSSEASQSL
jgi:hypothetical protein